ncbi:MAG TPA: biopolymer transporter ExbD [Opitutaceae bacterium]|jgi:biopolymer transport protein TolR|nr:biopolymer transporter ExbD [Opitutaceae bacterium]
MARTFRRPKQANPIAELNVTNLIDLGFTLLIIFMIATPLIQQDQTIALNLPKEAKSAQTKPPPDTEFVAVSIDKNGNYYYADRPVGFAELKNLLGALAAKPKEPVIRIRADGALAWQKVITLVAELKRHNLTRITFDTQSAD